MRVPVVENVVENVENVENVVENVENVENVLPSVKLAVVTSTRWSDMAVPTTRRSGSKRLVADATTQQLRTGECGSSKWLFSSWIACT